MSIEPLYQADGDAKTAPSTSTFLLGLIRVLRILSFIFLAAFIFTFLASLLALLGVEPFRTQLFSDIDVLESTVSSFTMIIGTVAFLVILKQLKLICQTLAVGDPFVPENANRLRTIWIAVALAEFLRLIAGLVMSKIRNSGATEGVELTLDLRIYVWFLILALIVLTEVFREGTRLRQEQKLTI